jgi:hypothetical protein
VDQGADGSSLFEALFDLERWFSDHLVDHFLARDVDEETQKERRRLYSAAKDRLDRTLVREEWLLPDEVNQLFIALRGVFDATYENWFDDLDSSCAATIKTRGDLVDFARRQLSRY